MSITVADFACLASVVSKRFDFEIEFRILDPLHGEKEELLL